MLGFALTLELLSCAVITSICEANYSSRQYASEGWDNIPPNIGFIPLHTSRRGSPSSLAHEMLPLVTQS